MTILCAANTLEELSDYRADTIPGSNYINPGSSAIGDMAAPAEPNNNYFIGYQGFKDGFAPRVGTGRTSGTEPGFNWDFSSHPNKPILGDKLSLKMVRFDTMATNAGNTNGNPVVNQWIYRFMDASNNVIGGIYQKTNNATTLLGRTGLYLVVNGDGGATEIQISSITPFFANSQCVDYTIECTVTASSLSISLYIGANIANDTTFGNPTLVSTVTAVNTIQSFGPPVKVGFGRAHNEYYTSGNFYYGNRDQGAYLGPIFAVNEDMSKLWVWSAYDLALSAANTSAVDRQVNSFVEGFDVRSLGVYSSDADPLTKRVAVTPVQNRNLAAISATFNVAWAKFKAYSRRSDDHGTGKKFSYGVRVGGVNYTLADSPAVKSWCEEVVITTNPATGLPFASPFDIVFYAGTYEAV